MPRKITTALIDDVKGMVHHLATAHSRSLAHLRYCDVRLEVADRKSVV